ncbi:enoyl-CoA hydratase/carnithine racemase [Tepidimonas ignava]|uniref:1,2-epoxyphenylacetyl-CoA isomerase n=1 Tax=Tepidimonas ignava TaxID=114249 RepID=A0A4R3LLF4_9BURK|nr:enoyl-CoA hydratase [Tepidimonas ignava]TCS99384.1 enoyl-CoA hydratase/carnithine racemase [Tepidimonas ignava]TSE24211.1 1,2-epoxyphenylacetyl-CoA isomerase [Tepidimonas ignava]
MTATLQSHTHGNTLLLTIDNPQQRNALAPEIYVAGIEALIAAERNQEVRSVIITGAGGTFCAGGNLQRLLANRQQPPEVQAESIDALHGWIEAVRSFPKPVIAAVEGACAGAGFSLALACDLLVAARNAVFVMAYVNVGLSPDGGATWSLLRQLPRATALQLLMLGERTDAARLHQLGLVTTLTDPGAALAEALALAERLNAQAPNALASIKTLANDAWDHSLSRHLRDEREHFVRNLHHPNAGEGIQAFLDKRKPQYR